MSMNQIWLYDLFRKELHLPDDKAAAFREGGWRSCRIGNNIQKSFTCNKRRHPRFKGGYPFFRAKN